MEYTFDERSVSDLHKDAYGFRPSYDFWREWELSDKDGKQAIWDSMIDSLECDDVDPDPGDMDGDHGSALASAGWGTDEDYGFAGDDW